MLLRLLNALVPAVRLERELAVAREQLAASDARAARLALEVSHVLAQRDALERRFDRLVQARLLKDGAIATLINDPPPSSATSAPSPFGNIARMVNRPRPDGDDDLDSIPAGGTMLP